MALASSLVRATAVEATEFPELSGRYQVRAVPKIVVNDSFEFTGGLPEAQFVEAIVSGVATEDGSDDESTAL